MTRTLPVVVLTLFATLCLGAPANEEFEEILDRYFKIHASLAADSTEGIDAAAQSISQLATNIQTSDSQKQALAASLNAAAQAIQGKELEAARQEFLELSKPLLAYLHQSYKGEKEYFRFYCSMAKKGWVQASNDLRNPYYGSSMLKCGKLIQ